LVKIAAFPKCYIEDLIEGKIQLEDWIDMSAELDCDGLELYNLFLASYDQDYLDEIRNRIRSFGMEIPMMCYSSDFTMLDLNDRKEQVKKQIEVIKVTAALGSSYCRTLSGQARPEVSIKQGVLWVIECIQECLIAAEKYNVKLVIENHFMDPLWRYREFAQRKDVFLKIINNISSPFFGVQYDPSNALVAGDDPIDVLDAVLPKVMTVHASDRYLLPGSTIEEMRQKDGTLGYPAKLIHGVTGQGTNDYDAIFSRLKKANFDGWISIEDGLNGMEEMQNSIDFLKSMRKKYFGV
jgi:sugar phosphate isomerase/epimerase